MTSGSPTAGQIPVHIGLAEPGTPGAGPRLGSSGGQDEVPLQERSPLVQGGVEWAKHGVEPRWLGQESGDCMVALEPGFFFNHGDAERKRFLIGAQERQETALLVSTIGNVNPESASRNVFGGSSASVHLASFATSVVGSRLPVGARPVMADGLDRADEDLAKRLLNQRGDRVWWALELSASQGYVGGGMPLPPTTPDGRLEPILIDINGMPVAAAWVPVGGGLRWYIVPDGTDWNMMIDWLVSYGLPCHVPAALRRARHATFVDIQLQTAEESRVRTALVELDEEYARRRAALQEQMERATEHAGPVRDGLLYGTGSELADAVSRVLSDAGFEVIDLDEELGVTDSADLLATYGSRRLLVEVKAASGNPKEGLVDFLHKHLATWLALRPNLPIDGGVLVVNNQHKLDPKDRNAAVYSRSAFVDTLPFPVISSRRLFELWCAEDWPAVRETLFGPQSDAGMEASSVRPETMDAQREPSSGRWLRRWRSSV